MFGKEYSIEFVLSDQLGASKSYKVKVKVPKPEAPVVTPPAFVFAPISVEVQKNKTVLKIEDKKPEIIINCTASIESVSARGELSVRFSHEMQTHMNLTQLNSTILDLYIIPSLDRHKVTDFKLSNLNFTWTTVSFEINLLVIQLNFTDPTFISSDKVQDSVVWHLKKDF